MNVAYKKLKSNDNMESPSLLRHLINTSDKYKLNLKDISSVMSEILFGGIDTVMFNSYLITEIFNIKIHMFRVQQQCILLFMNLEEI